MSEDTAFVDVHLTGVGAKVTDVGYTAVRFLSPVQEGNAGLGCRILAPTPAVHELKNQIQCHVSENTVLHL